MVQDHVRDKWTQNGTSEQFDTLIASIPDAILMTQQALGVNPVDDGFKVQEGPNSKKNNSPDAQSNTGSSSSTNGLARRNSAPSILDGRQPLSQAERIKNEICPNYPRNCRFGEVCKFQHVESKGQTGKQNVRSVAATESHNETAIEQKIEQKIEQWVTDAFTRVAKKFTGVTSPLPRKGRVATDHVTPDKGPSPRYSLPVSHACVRTCISEVAVTPESVVRPVCADFKSFISSILSVLSENSKRSVCTHACVRTVSSPKVVYQSVSPSVTYAQVIKSGLPPVCGSVESARRGIAHSKPNPR